MFSFQQVQGQIFAGHNTGAFDCINSLSEMAREKTINLCDTTCPTPIRIAIIDTGANLNHPACREIRQRIIHKENITGEDSENIVDFHGHGTQILSIYNELFKACPRAVEFVIIKAVSNDGKLTISNFRQAVVRLLERDMSGVQIVSVSAGFHISPSIHCDLAQKIEELKTKKIILAAASNGGAWNADCIAFPASITMSIGSVDHRGNRNSFSPQGKELDFLTVGSDIPVAASDYSEADPESHYTVTSGTSYAVPVAVSFVVHFLIQLPARLLGKTYLLTKCIL